MVEGLKEDVVSIIVPTLNEKENVLPLIKSIQMQTHVSVEVIFVDGGSNDGTRELLLSSGKKFSTPSLKLVMLREEDFAGEMGPAHARNIGIKAVLGDYFIFLDGDTKFLTPDSVSTLKRLLDSYDFVRVKTAIQLDTNLERDLASFHSLYYHCGYRKRIFGKVLFNEKLGFGEDRDLWYRIKRDLEVEVKTIDEVLLCRHLPHTAGEYFSQARWYGKTFSDFVENLLREKEYVYLNEVAETFIGCFLAGFPPLLLAFSFLKDTANRNVSIDFLFINFLRRCLFLFYVGRSLFDRKCLKNYVNCISLVLSGHFRKLATRSEPRATGTLQK